MSGGPRCSRTTASAFIAAQGSRSPSRPGLRAPLTTAAGKRAYLERLFGSAALRLKAGQVAVGTTSTYVEWHGTVSGAHGTGIPFGIVERFGPDGEWELYFDTLPLVADQDTIRTLFQKLASWAAVDGVSRLGP